MHHHISGSSHFNVVTWLAAVGVAENSIYQGVSDHCYNSAWNRWLSASSLFFPFLYGMSFLLNLIWMDRWLNKLVWGMTVFWVFALFLIHYYFLTVKKYIHWLKPFWEARTIKCLVNNSSAQPIIKMHIFILFIWNYFFLNQQFNITDILMCISSVPSLYLLTSTSVL